MDLECGASLREFWIEGYRLAWERHSDLRYLPDWNEDDIRTALKNQPPRIQRNDLDANWLEALARSVEDLAANETSERPVFTDLLDAAEVARRVTTFRRIATRLRTTVQSKSDPDVRAAEAIRQVFEGVCFRIILEIGEPGYECSSGILATLESEDDDNWFPNGNTFDGASWLKDLATVAAAAGDAAERIAKKEKRYPYNGTVTQQDTPAQSESPQDGGAVAWVRDDPSQDVCKMMSGPHVLGVMIARDFDVAQIAGAKLYTRPQDTALGYVVIRTRRNGETPPSIADKWLGTVDSVGFDWTEIWSDSDVFTYAIHPIAALEATGGTET